MLKIIKNKSFTLFLVIAFFLLLGMLTNKLPLQLFVNDAFADRTVSATQIDKNLLPSWNEGKTKKAIIEFVRATTDKKNSNYIPVEKRIATFDQDGTLWVEQPMYTQIMFAFARVLALASEHPEWKEKEPFKSILTHDKKAIEKFTLQDIEQIIEATHTGMTVESFKMMVKEWLRQAKNPRWNRPYTELVYQPMKELLQYLRANGYKTYIVTGGGQDFVRAYAEEIYGIPPEQVIGTAGKTQYSFDKKSKAVLMKSAKLLLNDNFSGKPEDINLFIGRRPIMAVGNSTGDQQMLEYTQIANSKRMMVLVHHDDSKREYAYGPNSKVGTFSNELMNEAKQRGWLIVSMKNDWKRIFSFEEN